MALPFTSLDVPFSNGLDQESGARAKSAPALDICKDVEFDEAGELRVRKPFVPISSDTSEGTTLTEMRRVVAYGNELLVFTKDALYSYSPTLEVWIRKATHLAVKTTERTVFDNPTDQVFSDRAELNGTVFYAWIESGSATGVHVAAADAETGTVLYSPTAVGSDSVPRCRLIALATRVLLFTRAGGNLVVYSLDPADPAAGIAAGAATIGSTSDWNLTDVVKVPGADQAVLAGKRSATTNYSMATVTAGLVVATATKARPCDGPIAVSCPPLGGTVQVARADGNHVEADLITISGFVDTAHVDLVLGIAGTVINQVTAAHRSTQDGGEYRCYVFWSVDESEFGSVQAADPTSTRYTYVDTGGNTGAMTALSYGLGLASRAFEYDGHVYVHCAFAGASILNTTGTFPYVQLIAQIQNSYFLYRDDKHLVAKICNNDGGGYAAVTGHLPTVQGLDDGRFAWCAVQRRRVAIGTYSQYRGYGQRSPREVLIEFDSNEARRTARVGETLYVSGSEIRQYDGAALTEVGFHTQPWCMDTDEIIHSVGLAVGSYSYRATYRWDNAKGERDRSSSFLTVGDTIGSDGHQFGIDTVSPLRPTHKSGVAVEYWRTQVNPPDGAPLSLVTSVDPADTSTDPNRYLSNPDPTSPDFVDDFIDAFDDDELSKKDSYPENSDVLESLSPPAATIMIASDTRLFLAGIAGDPDKIWYSKQRNDNEVVAFNDALTISVPRVGGDMTGLGFLSETLIAFRATAIYALPGDGYNNTGGTDGSQNYGPARTLSTDLGAVNHESIVTTPSGLVFKSRKGWYLLDRGFALQYVGGPVRDYDGEDVYAVHVVEAQHQIRIVTSGRVLVFDYRRNQWGEWSVVGIGAAIWQGTYGVLDSDVFRREGEDYTGIDYGYDVELAWVKPGGVQGDVRVRWFELLGEYRGSHHVRVRVARDYEQDGSGNWSYFDDAYWSPTPTVIGNAMQVRHSPSRQNLTAIKVRFTAVNAGNHAIGPSTEAAKLSAVSFEYAPKRPLNRRLGSSQHQ